MAVTPRGGRAAAALRAAHAWTGLKDEEFADELGISKRQLSRYKAGDTPVPYEVRARVSQFANIPRGFLDVGFGDQHSATVTPGVEELARRLDELAAEFSAWRVEHVEQIRDEIGRALDGGPELDEQADDATASDTPAKGRRSARKGGDGR